MSDSISYYTLEQRAGMFAAMTGCLTGDCPHNFGHECLTALSSHIGEIALQEYTAVQASCIHLVCDQCGGGAMPERLGYELWRHGVIDCAASRIYEHVRYVNAREVVKIQRRSARGYGAGIRGEEVT